MMDEDNELTEPAEDQPTATAAAAAPASARDPFEMQFDLEGDAYDKLLHDADIDNRVGDHEMLVAKVDRGHWPDGQPRLKVSFQLLTANNAVADWTWSPPPPPDVVARESSKWERKMQQAVAGSIRLARQLKEHWNLTPGQLKVGMTLKGKTAKTKIDKDTNKGGFIRVIAFLSKDHAVGPQAAGENGDAEGSEAPPNVGF